MSRPDKELYHVLVADDSEDDRLLLRKALRLAPSLQITAEVSDGEDVIAYFRGHAGFTDRERFPLPDLLLLDLKMPVKDGFAVLEWLRQQPCEELTVVVLTDSMHPEHIKRALDLGADLFQVKPKAHQERSAMILALEDYLLRRSTKPSPLSGSRLARSLA